MVLTEQQRQRLTELRAKKAGGAQQTAGRGGEFSAPAPQFSGVANEFQTEAPQFTGEEFSQAGSQLGSLEERAAFGALEPVIRAGELGEAGFAGAFEPTSGLGALQRAESTFEAGGNRFTRGLQKIAQGIKAAPDALTGNLKEGDVTAVPSGFVDLIAGGLQSILGSAVQTPQVATGFIADALQDVAPNISSVLRTIGQVPESVVAGAGGTLGGALEGIPRGAAITAGVNPDDPNIRQASELFALLPPLKVVEAFTAPVRAGVSKVRSGVVEGLTGKSPVTKTAKIITDTIDQHIRPSRRAKSKSQLDAIRNKEGAAVQDIFDNRDTLRFSDEFGNEVTGKTPATMAELADAQANRFKDIFFETHEAVKEATGQGLQVDLAPVAINTLENMTSKLEVLDIDSAPVVNGVLERLAQWEKRGSVSPEFAELAIKDLNSRLAEYKKNPNTANFSNALVESTLVKSLRDGFFDAMDKVTGIEEGAFRGLRTKMAQHKSLEAGIVKRVDQLTKERKGGVLSIPDAFASGEAAAGLFTGNPAMLLRAGTQFGTRILSNKFFRDANAGINRMFNKLKKDAGVKTPKQVKRANVGVGLRSVGAGIERPTEQRFGNLQFPQKFGQ